MVINGVIERSQVGHRFGPGNVMHLVGGGAATLLGLMIVAFGELVGVVFTIEENTRNAANYASRWASPSSLTGVAAVVALFLVFVEPVPAAKADEIPKADLDAQAAATLHTAVTLERAYFAAHGAYIACGINCSSKLPGVKIPDGVVLFLFVKADYLTGEAFHRLGETKYAYDCARGFEAFTGAFYIGPRPTVVGGLRCKDWQPSGYGQVRRGDQPFW